MSKFNKASFKAIAERVLMTGLQVAIPAVGVGTLTSIAWLPLLNLVGAAMFLSLLKNVLSTLSTGSPSFGDLEKVPASGPPGDGSDMQDNENLSNDGFGDNKPRRLNELH